MKLKSQLPQTLKAAALCAVIAAASASAFAGTMSSKAPIPPPAPPPEPFVTGTLSFTVDTHFMSYGQDVWGAGNSWSDPLFHPFLELNFNLGGGFTGILGTWWDVNDNAESSIGGKVQEVDVWAGFAYSFDKWTVSLVYQEWMYASQSERIIDLKLAYDHFLNPSLILHGRVDGAEPFDTGLVTVLGVAPGTELGPVSLSFPVQVSFDTDGFHGGDAGFGYVSAGIAASIPLMEHVSLNLGVTYYHTNDEVIVTNPDDDLVMGSAGITITF